MTSASLLTESLRANIVDSARHWIGTPYCHQASSQGVGADCLGLVRGVWRDVIGPEPEALTAYAPDWAESSCQETLLAAAQRHFMPQSIEAISAGAVLLFRWRPYVPAKHIAIASSPSTMIHAHEGIRVCEVDLTSWWRRHLAAAFEFPCPMQI